VDRDGGPEIIHELGKPPVNAVADAAAARLVARKALLVEDERIHPAARQRERGQRSGRAAADHDDFRLAPSHADRVQVQ